MARRRTLAEPVAVLPVPDEIPEWLRCGPWIEVWAAGYRGEGGFDTAQYVAGTRHRAAVEAWLRSQGIDPADRARVPRVLRLTRRYGRSFVQMERQDPGLLAAILRNHGMSADWRPTPAPAEWLR